MVEPPHQAIQFAASNKEQENKKESEENVPSERYTIDSYLKT